MKLCKSFSLLFTLLVVFTTFAQRREAIPFSDFEHWVTRNMRESALLGGNDRTLYAIAPDTIINGVQRGR